MKLAAALLCVTFLVGCHAVQAPIPGSANQFDSDTYLSLVTTDSLIQSTKADLANNSFSATIVPSVKKALNDLIAAYDTANTAYVAYHTAAIAGTATTTQQSTVAVDMTAVSNSTSALLLVKGGTK